MPEAPDGPVPAPLPDFEDAAGNLRPFYSALAEMQRGSRTAPVRIAFYGDSNHTLDGISGGMRDVIQAQLGDAGHGFIGFGSPWRGYRHQGVKRSVVGHYETFIYTRGAKPRSGGFGLAGMAALGGELNARHVFRLDPAQPPRRFTVYYLAAPKAGTFAIRSGRQTLATQSATAEAPEFRHVAADLPTDSTSVSVHNTGKGPIHFYGGFIERTTSGVVVDSFGVTGATWFRLTSIHDRFTQAMLTRRNYDLVLFQVGTNFWKAEANPARAAEVIARHREANPGVPIALISPPDHVTSKRAGHSDPRVVKVVAQLRQIAKTAGVAFWDFRAAMGGDASMRTFYFKGLAAKDLYHFAPRAAALMGRRLGVAVLRAYRDGLKRDPEIGCPTSP